MPDPPPAVASYLPLTPLTVPPLAAADSSGPWANDLFPAVLLLALGAALVALGAWIVKPPPGPPQPPERPPRSRGGRRRNRGRPTGPNSQYASSPPDPLRRPLRLP
ncbi:hypothetical protein [Alienimonas sp. DA493]|uniref:hypothetical protein n=1 Tax=Alienimonas sp. DA493 TaxID=3373605 RepID=UPI003754E9DD